MIDRVTAHRCRLLVYDVDAVFREHETRRLHVLLSEHAAELLASPGPIATAGGVLHVAEAATGRILSFDLSGQFLGAARWTGGVSALELDAQGRLLVQPASGSLVRLQPAQTAAAGTFRIGPITVEHAPIGGPAWQELRARLDPLPDGAHVRLSRWPRTTRRPTRRRSTIQPGARRPSTLTRGGSRPALPSTSGSAGG